MLPVKKLRLLASYHAYNLSFYLINISRYLNSNKPPVEIWIICRGMAYLIFQTWSKQENKKYHLLDIPDPQEKVKRAPPLSPLRLAGIALKSIIQNNNLILRLPHLSEHLAGPAFSKSCNKFYKNSLFYFYEDGLTVRVSNPAHNEIYPNDIESLVVWNFLPPISIKASNIISLDVNSIDDKRITSRNIKTPQRTQKTCHIICSKHLDYEALEGVIDKHYINYSIVYYPHPNAAKNPKIIMARIFKSGPIESLELFLAEEIKTDDVIICGYTATPMFLKELEYRKLMSRFQVHLLFKNLPDDALKMKFREISEFSALMKKNYTNIISNVDC